MIFHVIFALSIVSAVTHLYLTRSQSYSRDRVVEIVLLHLLCIQWGFGAALTSIPHIVTPDAIAELVGWAPGSPFQLELGFASLGTSILGILSIWLRGWFWLAPIVSRSVFLLGAAGIHIRDIVENGNLSDGSAGPVLFYDIAVPFLTTALFVSYARTHLVSRAA